MRQRRYEVMSILVGVSLAGCSAQPTGCETFFIENITHSELDDRYPSIVGRHTEARDWVDSSQFQTKCLYIQHPEFQNGMDYYGTRESRGGEKVFLFTPFAVTDTLIGFVIRENDAHVVVVGML
jgi:hypothetical protein